MHVDEVLAELSAEEIAEWQAYARLEPFGNEWIQTALLASLTANANRDTEAHPDPFELEQFLPEVADDVPVEMILQEDGENADPTPDDAAEPPWMAWKRLFTMMAAASDTNTHPSPE